MAYYVGYQIGRYPIADIEWSAITHVAFAPMVVKADLTLDLTFDDSGNALADAKAISAGAHANGVGALLMLGGADAGANIATAASAGNRDAFVAALLSAIDTLGYDGIDLDWEDSVNLDDLVALAQALRAARPQMLLTYPGPTINGNIETVDPRMATLAASLDRFFVQTYYPSTAVAGSGWDSWFVAPLSGAAGATPIAIDDSLARYVAAGVPTEKLGFGAGFFAICYTGGITAPRQTTTATTKITGGDNAYPSSALFAHGGTLDGAAASELERDAVAQEPYLSLAAPVTDLQCGGDATQYISYDDEVSFAAKGAFAQANGYGGIILWTLAQGVLPAGASGGRAPDALLQAIANAFH